MNEGNLAELRALWEQAHSSLEKTDFKKKWENGTGYLNGAVEESPIVPQAFTDYIGRKGILLPMFGLTFCIFERYAPDTGKWRLVCNPPGDMPLLVRWERDFMRAVFCMTIMDEPDVLKLVLNSIIRR